MRARCSFLPGFSLLALFLGALLPTSHAAPGDLDATLNQTGKIRGGIGGAHDDGDAMAIQSDGKILVAGSGSYDRLFFSNIEDTIERALLARYHADGSVDHGFGEGRGYVTAATASDAAAGGVAIQSDGKIVVVGTEFVAGGLFPTPRLFVARFHPDGTPDTTFDDDGVANPLVSGRSFGNAVAVSSDKIIIAGQVEGRFAVLRLGSNGTLDADFGGGDGIANLTFSGVAHDLALTSNRILATGASSNDSSLANANVAVVRLDSTNGAPDTTFDADGVAITSLPSTTEYGNVIRVQPGNQTVQNPDKIVVAGVSDGRLTVLRYTTSGILDASFDGDGVLQAMVAAGNVTATGLGFQIGFGQAASRIVVSGSVGNSPNRDFIVVRLLLSGAFDTAFDGDGYVTAPVGPTDDVANAMLVRSGKITVIGTTAATSNFDSSDLALARFNLTDGALDATFDTDGKRVADVFDLPSTARSVALQSDGRIVVAGSNRFAYYVNPPFGNGFYVPGGNFFVARYNVDGTPDGTFASDGSVSTAVNGVGEANGMALQADGKIVVVGTNADVTIAARYLPSGALDPDFAGGVTGVGVTSKTEAANAVAVQADGKIVLAGWADTSASSTPNRDFALVRLLPNGTPDNGFSGDGKLTTAIGAGEDEIKAVALQPDGKILVAGFTFNGSNKDFVVARYTSSGVLDFGFGATGRTTVDLSGADDVASAVAMQGAKIIFAGAAGNDIFLARLGANGMIDGTFGDGGVRFTDLGGGEGGVAMAIQADGKILIAAQNTADFLVVRYSADGMLDPSYGTGGVATVPFSPGSGDVPYALTRDALGRAVVVGESQGVLATARVLGDAFLRITSITRVNADTIRLEGLGTPGFQLTIQAAPNLNVQLMNIGSTTPTSADGLWTFEEAGLTGIPMRFYRATSP